MMRKILIAINALFLIILVVGTIACFRLASRIPRLPDDLNVLATSPATEIYARNGDLIATLGGREYVPIQRISPYFLKAVVAAEDKRFYTHHGLDHPALFRSLILNLVQRGAPGGSTITQQLAKNLFFTFKRSWQRKPLEALAAMAIEDRFSKEDILETYSNLVDFGRNAYGIERAAQVYFGKHASELELHEAALLAGLLNAPSRYDPFNHPDRARKKIRTILQRMVKEGMVRQNDVDSISGLPLNLAKRSSRLTRSSYPIDHSLEISRGKVGSELVSYGGIRIITTVDPVLQRTAEHVIERGIRELEKRLKPLPEGSETRLEGALVAIDVASGDILAMVGGHNYWETPYNRAVYSRRAPGSSFKPAVYLTALEELQITPATVMMDTMITLQIDRKRTWSPKNFGNKYLGPVTLKLALMKSINTIAAQLIDAVGPEKVVKNAQLLGIETPLGFHLSTALGAQGVSPVEMAAMFATIARQGVSLPPHIVARIEGRGGESLFELLSAGKSRFSRENVYILIDMLKGVIDGGSGSIIRRNGFHGVAIGKTGTSNEFRDAWFVGATTGLSVAVWVGYDDNRPMRFDDGEVGVTGGAGAAPLWADFMIRATAGEPIREFPRPRGVERAYIDPVTGVVSSEPADGLIPAAFNTRDLEAIIENQIESSVDSTSAADSLKVDTLEE